MIKTKVMASALSAIITSAFLRPCLAQSEKPATRVNLNLPTIQKAVICEKVENRIRDIIPPWISLLPSGGIRMASKAKGHTKWGST